MAVVVVSMVRSRAQFPQVQTFGTYGAAIPDNTQQQQQLYQSPVQGLRLQLSNPAALNLPQQPGQQHLAPSSFSQNSFAAPQSAYQNLLPQQYQQLAYPQQYEQQTLPQQYQQQTLPQQYQQQALPQQYQQPQFPESVLTSAAQFRNTVSQQPVRFRAPAPVTQTTSDVAPASTTTKTAPVPGVLGVAFSPASEVSQLRFSGSFANFSY